MLAAFPFAYGALMPALYGPILIMLLALILRGVAFEFRHHGRGGGKAFWTAAFVGGSVAATLAQGLALGGFIQGVTLEGTTFAGGPFDWLTPYSGLVAVGLVAGYALLGATWIIWRTEGEPGQGPRWAGPRRRHGVLLAVSARHPPRHPASPRAGASRTGSIWRPSRRSGPPILLLGGGPGHCGFSPAAP